MQKALQEMFQRQGMAPDEARTQANQVVHNLQTAQSGSSYGGQWESDLPALWQRAARDTLRLRIDAEGDADSYCGHLTFHVLDDHGGQPGRDGGLLTESELPMVWQYAYAQGWRSITVRLERALGGLRVYIEEHVKWAWSPGVEP